MDRASAPPWTRDRVEAALIDAFRRMPSCPVFSTEPARVRTAAGDRRTALTEVLEWTALLRDDQPAQRFLWAWARCRATRSSFGGNCRDRGKGWSRSTPEAGRRRAADRDRCVVEPVARTHGTYHGTSCREPPTAPFLFRLHPACGRPREGAFCAS